MDTITYMNDIANQFGGFNQNELKLKLERLVTLAIQEEGAKKIKIITKNATPHIKEIAVKVEKIKPIPIPLPKPIFEETTHIPNDPKVEPVDDYSKSMKLVRALNNKGWIHISEVPIELFRNFWNIAEMHEEIVFDKERDYQYFRVNDFSRR